MSLSLIRKTESILYYYAQALQPLTFLEKQLGSPVNCREFYDFWSPSAILASAIRTISCQGMARQRVCGGFPRPRGAIGMFHKAFASYFNLKCSQRPPIAMSKALHAVGAAVLMDRAPLGKLPCQSVQKNEEHIRKLVYRPKISRLQFTVYLQYCSARQSLRTLDLQSIFVHFTVQILFRVLTSVTAWRITSGISTLMALRCRSAFPKPPRTSWVRCQVGYKTIHSSECLIIFMYVYVCFCRVVEDFDMWRETKHEEKCEIGTWSHVFSCFKWLSRAASRTQSFKILVSSQFHWWCWGLGQHPRVTRSNGIFRSLPFALEMRSGAKWNTKTWIRCNQMHGRIMYWTLSRCVSV